MRHLIVIVVATLTACGGVEGGSVSPDAGADEVEPDAATPDAAMADAAVPAVTDPLRVHRVATVRSLVALRETPSGVFVTDDAGTTFRLNSEGSTVSLTKESMPRPITPGIAGETEPAWGDGSVELAWYTKPVDRYRHGALGDAAESEGLALRRTDAEAPTSLTLEPQWVFEDVAPRLVDLDGDGVDEVVTIRANLELGAAITAYAVEGQTLVELGGTPPLGTPFRWLNIIDLRDIDGDGAVEALWVERPHLDATLVFARWNGSGFDRLDEATGWSNHRYGSTEQRLAGVADLDADGRHEVLIADKSFVRLALLPLDDLIGEPVGEVTLGASIVTDLAQIAPGKWVAGASGGGLFVIRVRQQPPLP